MTIGAALLLLAAGAILRFALSTVYTHGVNLHVIGDILMIVGVLGLVLWLVVWLPRRRRRPAYPPEEPPAEVYTERRRTAYPGGERYAGERHYEDQYPPGP